MGQGKHVPGSVHTEKLGLAMVERVCAETGFIFRRLSTDDLGVDGIIEVITDGMSTGLLFGVQIKSGSSYVKAGRFRLAADRDHFSYWARYSLPVIGIVYDPQSDLAVWFNISAASTYERIVNGPYFLCAAHSEHTAFTPEALQASIFPAIRKLIHQRWTLAEVRRLVPIELPSHLTGSGEVRWRDLGDALLATSINIHEIGEIAYLVSMNWSTNQADQAYMRRCFHMFQEFHIYRFIIAVHEACEQDRDDAAEKISLLLTEVPNVVRRLRLMRKKGKFPAKYEGTLNDVIRMLKEF